jgi:hypothetical protein
VQLNLIATFFAIGKSPIQPREMSALNILYELSALVGETVLKTACRTYLDGADAPAPKKVKKERKPRGKSSWNLEVDKVLEEMRQACVATGKSAEEAAKEVTYKMAFAEASRRRREGDPEAQAKYEANQAKREAKREAKGKSKKTATPTPTKKTEEMDYGETDEESASVDGVPARLDPKTVYQYLFDLQESGVTNMLGCKPYLQREFSMTESEADDIRQEFVSRYGELKKKYGAVQAPPAQKKRAKEVPATTPAPPAQKKRAKESRPLPASRAKISVFGEGPGYSADTPGLEAGLA